MNSLQNKKICLSGLVFVLLFAFLSSAQAKNNYTRTVEKYEIPDVVLINQDGERIRLKKHLDTDKVVVLEFIFSTCTTICPILTINFTNLQKQLGREIDNVRMVSISIDPEKDTPEILKSYLQKYQARPGWDFFTGDINDITKIMKAFKAHVSDKMGHRPLIFLRAPKAEKWVRIDGLMSGEELKSEYLKLKL
jgi:protein SCO1/2